MEILRYMPSQLVRGRTLDVEDASRCEDGSTSYILVDREQLLETAFDEISGLAIKFLTLEVQFYGEVLEQCMTVCLNFVVVTFIHC